MRESSSEMPFGIAQPDASFDTVGVGPTVHVVDLAAVEAVGRAVEVDPDSIEAKAAHRPVIVLGERHLYWLLRRYVDEYYHPCRTHLSLGKDAPMGRETEPPKMGNVIELPVVGGLHHRYTRRAA